MPAFLAPLLLAAAPALAKGALGLIQGEQANNLKQEDYTPPAFTEALNMGKQAAAAQMPGLNQEAGRINQGFASTAANAVRAGGNSSSVLGTLLAADSNRNQALANLAVRGDQYRQQGQQRLIQLNQQQAGYQLQNKQNFDRTKSALTEAKYRNLFGAVEGAASAGVYAMGKADGQPDYSMGSGFAQYGNLSKPFSTVPMRDMNPFGYLG